MLSPDRGVAQLVSALVWGTRGRRFESARPDQPFARLPFLAVLLELG